MSDLGTALGKIVGQILNKDGGFNPKLLAEIGATGDYGITSGEPLAG